MRIAFQGAPGAYSEMAAQRAWPGVETVPCEQFEHVFASVAEGRTSHGLLHIENSIGCSTTTCRSLPRRSCRSFTT
jgi:prephenate dehydratase